jgi:hypothetical protein
MSTPIKSRRSNVISNRSEDPLAVSPVRLSSLPSPPFNDSDDNVPVVKHVHTTFHKWQRRIPCLKRAHELFLRIPPQLRVAFIFFWFCWKIFVTILVIFVFVKPAAEETSVSQALGAVWPVDQTPTKVLYIITTLAEYNTGSRATQRGQDRLGEVLIPILVDSLESIRSMPNLQVDVFLIAAYELKPEREQFIRELLPEGVGFQVWDDACPLGYDEKKLTENTRALARQHRYVIKDKFAYYDLFLAFEDDMRITGHHLEHFIKMSAELEKLRQQAPLTLPDVPENLDDPKNTKFYGQLTQPQMNRMVPGLIRVEVLLNELEKEKKMDPIPMDFKFDDGEEHHVHPEICCDVHMEPNAAGTPEHPKPSDLVIWETQVKAFSLREMPPGSDYLDWSVVMLGPGKRMDRKELVGGYWSGRDGAWGDDPKPSGGHPEFIAQQGGWMATREQIGRMNSGLCMGSFLPPFDGPVYYEDGQQSMNVEFWSGSYQFFTGVRGGCNMQRIISMHPDHFSKHLIYHVANNKQRQLASSRMLRADHLFGQLNTVRKKAIKAKQAMEKKKKQ